MIELWKLMYHARCKDDVISFILLTTEGGDTSRIITVTLQLTGKSRLTVRLNALNKTKRRNPSFGTILAFSLLRKLHDIRNYLSWYFGIVVIFRFGEILPIFFFFFFFDRKNLYLVSTFANWHRKLPIIQKFQVFQIIEGFRFQPSKMNIGFRFYRSKHLN